MKDTERDKFDELFRQELYNFEAQTEADDWARIAGHLHQEKSVPLIRFWKYIAAAVLVSFAVTSGFYFISRNLWNSDYSAGPLPVAPANGPEQQPVRLPATEGNEEAGGRLAEFSESFSVGPVVGAGGLPAVDGSKKERAAWQASVRGAGKHPASRMHFTHEVSDTLRTGDSTGAVAFAETSDDSSAANRPADATEATLGPATKSCRFPKGQSLPVARTRRSGRTRSWEFGVGGGAFTSGTSNSLPALAGMAFCGTDRLDPESVKNGNLAWMKVLADNQTLFASAASQKALRTHIEHHTPVSFGLSVSKRLNDRFSLQSGLVYTYLSSEWDTEGQVGGKAKQKLHYLGIPLSLTYKIAEWNKFLVYASAGGMGEINVAGKTNIEVYDMQREINKDTEKTRMKEPLWSLQGNLGVSYPLVRFLRVYAEAGGTYYFDNGSEIETIRSEKPFHVNFHLGFRFGF